jgi:transposase
MNSQVTQLESKPAPTPVVCWTGLDWADQKHCLAVRTTARGPSQLCSVEQKPEALDEFFLQLRAQHPQGRIAVGIEQKRGPALYALLKYDFLEIYPINPRALSDYRRAFYVSGPKDDPCDADLLSEMVSLHADRLRTLEVEEPLTRQLRLLTEHRRDFVADRTLLSNRLTSTLKCYYPQALELIGESLTEKMGLDFLGRWPTLAALKKAKPGVVRDFFYQHNSRSEEKITARLEAIKQAKPLTEDPALIEPLELQASCLVRQLRRVGETIDDYDERIRKVFAQHSEAWLFDPLPGAGPALAPRLAAAFGTIRANYGSSDDMLCFSGVAPVKRRSGSQSTVHFRYARPLFLHQSFVEFAKCSIGQCPWAKLLYEHERKRGKGKWAALRKVAFKWIRILWRCWTDRKPYNETHYLRQLQSDGLTLYASLYETLPPATTVA